MVDRHARLFFALRPPEAAVAEMERLREAAGAPGTRVAGERLHVTLVRLGDHPSLPRRLVERASASVAPHMLAACRIVLDLLVFGRRSMLLMPSEPVVGVLRLRAGLTASLAQAGIAPPLSHFAPHVTLGYRGASGPTRAFDPIGWRAEELLLIHSHLGAGRHDVVGRWPLATGG